jgi:hypothetical protein
MPPHLFAQGLTIEIIYSFIIIVCSLMIYFGTRELSKLSLYKGIQYFRQAFLFFAIAYIFRSFIRFLLITFERTLILEIPMRFLSHLTLALFIYFGTMAIFYLLYSVLWKKWDGKRIYLFHTIAIVLAILSIIIKGPFFYFGINVFLFILMIIIVLIAYHLRKKKRKSHSIFFIYVLLLAFWILNILDILVPDFLQLFQLLIYLASIFLFLLILYKVIKKTGAN